MTVRDVDQYIMTLIQLDSESLLGLLNKDFYLAALYYFEILCFGVLLISSEGFYTFLSTAAALKLNKERPWHSVFFFFSFCFAQASSRTQRN